MLVTLFLYKMCMVAAVLCLFMPMCWALNQTFPPGFKFGAASAAYQIEGARNVSGTGENIWDRFLHQIKRYDGANGEVACDSYNQWSRDVEMLEELEVNFYRFSISWSRILPSGFANQINSEGIKHYNEFIDALIAKGIEPMVTMYHLDLPQKLQDYGGWLNPLIADWFADYAKVLYENYGDRVKTWFTINEPIVMCDFPYNSGLTAPGIVDPDHASYHCTKNVLLSHAKAWRLYDEHYRHKYNGKVSYINNYIWIEGVTEADGELADFAMQYAGNRFDHPVYSETGGWPPALEEYIAQRSKKQGWTMSRLPAFTQEEIDLIKGTYDFYALNHYTSRTIRPALPDEVLGSFFMDDCPELNARLGIRPEWKGWSEIFPIYPKGLRLSLLWLKRSYGNIEIFITENGYITDKHDLEDNERVQFIRDHMEQVLLSIQEDGVNVVAYTYWTLMDNFEWAEGGYKSKFGLYHVDFNDPHRRRTPRKSVYYYRSVIRNHSIDVPLEPEGWADDYPKLKAQLANTSNVGSSLCFSLALQVIIFLNFTFNVIFR